MLFVIVLDLRCKEMLIKFEKIFINCYTVVCTTVLEFSYDGIFLRKDSKYMVRCINS